MEADPAVEFDYYLAEKLGKTLTEIHDISSLEYAGWITYFNRKAQKQELQRLMNAG